MVDNKETYMKNINVRPSGKKIDEKCSSFLDQCYADEGLLSMLWRMYKNRQLGKKSTIPEIFNYIPDKYLINENDFLNLFKAGYNRILYGYKNFIDDIEFTASHSHGVEEIELNNLIDSLKEEFPSINLMNFLKEEFPSITAEESENKELKTITLSIKDNGFFSFSNSNDDTKNISKTLDKPKILEKTKNNLKVIVLDYKVAKNKNIITHMINLYTNKVKEHVYSSLLENIDILYAIYHGNEDIIVDLLNKQTEIPFDRLKNMYSALYTDIIGTFNNGEKENKDKSNFWGKFITKMTKIIKEDKGINYSEEEIKKVLNPFVFAIFTGNIEFLDLLLNNIETLNEIGFENIIEDKNKSIYSGTKFSWDSLFTLAIKSGNINMVKKIAEYIFADTDRKKTFLQLRLGNPYDSYISYIIDILSDIKNIKDKQYAAEVITLLLALFDKKDLILIFSSLNNNLKRLVDELINPIFIDIFLSFLEYFKKDASALRTLFIPAEKSVYDNHFLFKLVKKVEYNKITKKIFTDYINYIDKNMENSEGNNLAFTAILNNNNDIAKFLIEKNIPYKVYNNNKINIYSLAVMTQNEEIIQNLLKKVDANKEDYKFLFNTSNGNIPNIIQMIQVAIKVAIKNNDLELLKSILDYKIKGKLLDTHIIGNDTRGNTWKQGIMLSIKNETNESIISYLQNKWKNDLNVDKFRLN